jgi:putative nucleotidyltransferase with HDIG domain
VPGGQRADEAWGLAERLLAEPLPRRWLHSIGVANQATMLRPLLRAESELLESAAVLHDIGYSPELVVTGFHAIDGARYLRDVVGADDRIVRLVAHHSCAVIEAEERNLISAMAEFKPEIPLLTDAMIYCDMTTTPDGQFTSASERVTEVAKRYGPDGPVARFIDRAAPILCESTARIEEMLAATLAQPI